MQKIITTSVGDQSYELLLNSIITGELAPGERIIELDLAAKFDISRTPLREALHRLEQDGMLVRLPKRGLAVSPVSVEEAEQLSVVRSYIEGLAVRLTTENLTDQQIDYLKRQRNNINYDEIISKPDEMKAFGVAFHTFVKQNCNNVFCQSYLNKIQPIVARYKNIGVSRPGRRIQSLNEHLVILDYMIDKNALNAEIEMRKHIEVSLKGSIEKILSDIH